jgi:trigger factor
MSYEIERTAPCRVVLSATIAADEVAGEREHVVKEFLRHARIDGFRPGKAPRAVVERKFAGEIREDVQEHLFRHTWDEVRREARLRPAGPLEVKKADWQDDGSFALAGEFDVYPEVTLPPLDGFVPPAFDLEPGADEIDRALAELRERQAAWEPVEDGVVAEGMLVETEVHGEFPEGGGEPFHEERSLFQVGRNEVFPEIEAAVLGHRVGEEVGAERILGEEAGEERHGKRVAYRVLVKSLRRKRLPDADDAFAQSLGVDDGIDKLRSVLSERIRFDKLRARRDHWREALVHHLGGDRPLELPEQLVRDETREEVVKFAESLQRRGLDLEKAGIDWSRLEQDMRVRVDARLRAELLLDELAEARGVVVDDAAVDHEVQRQAQQLGVPFAELKGNLAKRGGLDRLRAILRREQMVDDVLRPHLGEGASDAGSDRR